MWENQDYFFWLIYGSVSLSPVINFQKEYYKLKLPCDRADILQFIFEKAALRLKTMKQKSPTTSVSVSAIEWIRYLICPSMSLSLMQSMFQEISAFRDFTSFSF